MRSTASAWDTVEAFEDPGQLFGGDACAAVANDQLEVRADVPQFNFDRALERELEGVRDEIETDFFPHLPIDIGWLRHWRTIDVEAQSSLLDSRAKDTRKLSREGREVHRFICCPDTPGFDARKIEQRINKPQQPQTVALDKIDLLIGPPCLQVCRAAELVLQFLQRPEHQRERRTELVADV